MKHGKNVTLSPIGEREGVRAGHTALRLASLHPRPKHKGFGLTFSPIREKGIPNGFSLIESLIVVSIIAIMSSLALQALPVARSHQQLVSDTEQIRALLVDAKERALNQVRPDTCLPNSSDKADVNRATCSDVGIAFVGNQVIEFADTNTDNKYTSQGPRDYVIATFSITAPLGSGSVSSLLFKSIPPSTILYANGNLLAPSATAKIILNGYGDLSRTLQVHSYGTIDVQ